MIELRSNQQPIRFVVTEDTPASVIRQARLERERFKRRLRRKNRTPEQRARDRQYHRDYRVQPGRLVKRRAQKRRWRGENRDHYNAYFRRYDQLTPGRKEYKARKGREYRARDRAKKLTGGK